MKHEENYTLRSTSLLIGQRENGWHIDIYAIVTGGAPWTIFQAEGFGSREVAIHAALHGVRAQLSSLKNLLSFLPS
jgi:hypothetical protein